MPDKPTLSELHDEMQQVDNLPTESISEGPYVTQLRFKQDEDITDAQRAQALRKLADWYDPPAE